MFTGFGRTLVICGSKDRGFNKFAYWLVCGDEGIGVAPGFDRFGKGGKSSGGLLPQAVVTAMVAAEIARF
ncbi:hypothetical protein KY285_001240 [Solanum tuberosum]|nr:hypothetical protein KY285_001240 [Solanum tuberosum]